MRRLVFLLLLAACQREWVREYDGAVPWTDDEETVTILLVRDELTGQPVEGAIVRQHLDRAMGRDGRWAPLVAEGRTDEFGLVSFRLPEDPWNCHWTVHAEGYAPTEAYGRRITEEVELRAGSTYFGRVLDFKGQPLPGALVEWKVGCAHSPSLAGARTDRNGVFVFDRIDDGEFVLEGPPGAEEYLCATTDAWGIPVNQVLPGKTIEGRVARADGTPPPWAVVTTSSRAPRAVAAADGSFALRTPSTRGALAVWWDGGFVEHKEAYAPGLPVVLSVEPRPDPPPVTVRLRVVEERGGKPPDAMDVHLDRLADGRRFSFEWSPWTAEVAASVPPGAYQLSAGSPSSPWVGGPVVIDTGVAHDLEITVRPQPKLRFELPGLPDDAPVRCRIVLANESWEIKRGDDPSHLPAAVPAWLRVDLGRTPYTFPIGPEHAGVRRADVRLPGRKFIRVAGLEDGLKAELLGEPTEIVDGPEPREIQAASAGLATFAVGQSWLQLAHPEKGFSLVKLDLPFETATVEPDCTLTPWPAPVELRVLLDDGTPVAGAKVTVLDTAEPRGCLAVPDEPSETGENGILRRRWLRDGLHVRIAREDCVDSWARLSGEPPYEVRLGSAVIEVDVSGLESPAGVFDGLACGPEDGTIVLRGIAKGPHTLVLGAAGRKSLVYRLVLRQGETRRIKPVPRPRG